MRKFSLIKFKVIWSNRCWEICISKIFKNDRIADPLSDIIWTLNEKNAVSYNEYFVYLFLCVTHKNEPEI